MLERDLLQKKKQFPFFYYTAAIVSTVFLILFTSQLLAVFHGSSRDHNSSVPDVQVPSEFIVNFTEHIDYENFSHKFDWKWHELLTPNGGFLVKIDERTGTRRIHGISMFHQLHCLGMIREGVQALQENVMIATGSTHQHQAGADSHHGQIMQHWLHCFDYLRQAREQLDTPLVTPLLTFCASRLFYATQTLQLSRQVWIREARTS